MPFAWRCKTPPHPQKKVPGQGVGAWLGLENTQNALRSGVASGSKMSKTAQGCSVYV
jgi:hypothetical protein